MTELSQDNNNKVLCLHFRCRDVVEAFQCEFGPIMTPAVTAQVMAVEAKLREHISDINAKLIKVLHSPDINDDSPSHLLGSSLICNFFSVHC